MRVANKIANEIANEIAWRFTYAILLLTYTILLLTHPTEAEHCSHISAAWYYLQSHCTHLFHVVTFDEAFLSACLDVVEQRALH